MDTFFWFSLSVLKFSIWVLRVFLGLCNCFKQEIFVDVFQEFGFHFSDISSSEKNWFSIRKRNASGIFRHCVKIEMFHNSCSLNLSKTLLFLNLERGTDLRQSRRLVRLSLVQSSRHPNLSPEMSKNTSLNVEFTIALSKPEFWHR